MNDKNLLRNNWAIIAAGVLFAALLLLRINSNKYSQDTLLAFELLQNILYRGDTLIYEGAKGWGSSFNAHFNLIYIVLAPLHLLGVDAMIYFWKFFCYFGFLLIVWQYIRQNEQADLPVFQKNLFLLLIAFHPTLISNLVSPDIWDSDLGLPLIGISIFSALRKNYKSAGIYILVASAVKEDIILIAVLFGLMLVILSKDYRYLLISVVSAIWFIVVTKYIMPSFASTGQELALLKFSFGDLGNTMGEVISNSILHPSMVLDNGLWLRKFSSIIIMIGCFGMLPLIRRLSVTLLIPTIGIFGYAILAKQPYLDFSKHNIISVFPFMAFGAYCSFSFASAKTRSILLPSTLIVSILITLLLQVWLRQWSFYFWPASNSKTVLNIKDRYIPNNSSLLTGGIGSPWVCHNNVCPVGASFSEMEIGIAKYEFILINLNTIFWEELSCNSDDMRVHLDALHKNPDYNVLAFEDNVVLLRRLRHPGVSSSDNWTKDFDALDKLNHDCAKPIWARSLRVM
jgi:hypothetical protein